MKNVSDFLRNVVVVIGSFLFILFALMALLSLYMIFMEGMHTLSLALFAGSAALCVMFYVYTRKTKNRTRNSDKLAEQAQKQNELLFIPKACGVCKEKLVVVERREAQDAFPKINLVDKTKISEYYCPECEQYFNINEKYTNFSRRPGEGPTEGGGKRYRFSASFLSKRIRKNAIIYALLTLLFLAIAIAQIVIMSRLKEAPLEMGVLFFGALFLFGMFLTLFQMRIYRSYRDAFFVLCPDGLTFFDGKTKSHYEWPDFRIACRHVGAAGEDEGVAFDTKYKTFLVSRGVVDADELIQKVLLNIRSHARIEPGL